MSLGQMNVLQEKLDRQDVEIWELRKKLVTYNTDMAIKDELNKQFIELDGWVQEAANSLKQTDAEQANVIKDLFEKLRKSEQAETSLRADNQRLTGVNSSLTDQLSSLRRQNEQIRHTAYVKTMEMSKINDKLRADNNQLQSEIIGVHQKLEECQTLIGRMKDKNGNLEKKLEECRVAEGGLAKRCRDLEAEAESARAKLEDAESRVTAEQGRRVEELREMRYRADETRQRGAKELAELQTTLEQDRQEAKAREKRFEQDVRDREEQLAAVRRDLEHVTNELTESRARLERDLREAETARERDREQAVAREKRLEQDVRDREEQLAAVRRDLEHATNELTESRARLERDLREAEAARERDREQAVAREKQLEQDVRDREEQLAALETRVPADDQKTVEPVDLDRLQTLNQRFGREASGDRCRAGGGGGGNSSAGDETTRCTPTPNTRVHDDDDDDDELVNELKVLYRDLEVLQNESKKRRQTYST